MQSMSWTGPRSRFVSELSRPCTRSHGGAPRPSGDLLLGVDLVKDSNVLHAAYNDSAGITALFNKNLLVRINRELGGHFEPDAFSHVSFWNETESRMELHLESTCRQSVRVDALDTTLRFYQGERIHTENSYKFTQSMVRENLSRVVKTEIGDPCQLAISGRYPFERSSRRDVPQADFGTMFGAGGRFDKVFQENLATYVDTSTKPWRFRVIEGTPLGTDSGSLP